MTLASMLSEREIKNAVIIDDAFDEVPKPDDLNPSVWPVFFDDLSDPDSAVLTECYPDFEKTLREQLQSSDGFVIAAWKNRNRLSAKARECLFSEYERTNSSERTRLEDLSKALTKLGLSCKPTGREFSEEARQADIIFIDLFLGMAHTNEVMVRAIERVKSVIQGREHNPPLVILMSRSTRLTEKRNEFRDEAKLLGSVFRVVSKAQLEKEGVLEQLLTRLANHYEDAKRVARFVHAWDKGLGGARERFIKCIRRLDLSDFAQIRALLLEFEGQSLGEYLLDVCDGVLQYEIEADPGTIAAAQELNKIDLGKYPAPHLTGTSDLQELVHRMVFHHRERLMLTGQDQLQFGDVLRWKNPETGANTDTVSLVVTPACDLTRDGVENALLLCGTLKSLAPSEWSYGANETKTAIVIAGDDERFCIKWNLKKIHTHASTELKKWVSEGAKLERFARLRTTYAIELQQKLLTDLGRIGQPANPPGTFPVTLSLFYVDVEGNAQPLDIDADGQAVCYVGRDAESKPVHRLVLSEQLCDALQEAVKSLDENNVSQSARASLQAFKPDQAFFTRFERGEIEVPSTDGSFKPSKNENNLTYVCVSRNGDLAKDKNITGECRKAAILIKVIDVLGAVS